MNNKIFYLFLAGMGILLIFFVIYIFSFFNKNTKETNLTDQSKLLSKEEKIIDNKKVAYDKMDQDSINLRMQNNLKVDFNSLFGSSRDTSKHKKGISKSKNDTLKNKKDTLRNNKHVTINELKDKNVSNKTNIPVKQTKISNSEPNNKVTVSTKKDNEIAFNKFSGNQDTTHKNLNPQTNRKRSGFYSSTNENTNKKVNSNQNISQSLSAVSHIQQEVYAGSTIKLRTTSPFTLNNQNIPANTFLYGLTSIREERVYINVSSINVNGKIFSTSLSVYDQDGQEGIHIPGLVQHEMTKEAIKNATNNVSANLNVNVPIVGNVATIPINVAKRKQNIPTAIITEGYQVILKSK